MESFKKKIIGKGILANKIEVIKNGANLELYQPKQKNQQLINELGLNGKKILGYIGTHGMAHKLDFILDCAHSLKSSNPEFHFLLIGNGAEKKALLEKVKVENLTNVTMLDSVPKDEVVEYLSILDAAIINLKKNELFTTVIPSKIFETSAMQIPILLGVDGEARSIVEKYNAGLYYEPENIESFNTTLMTLFSNEILYNDHKVGCKKLAQEFNRERLAFEMLNIIKLTYNN